MENQEKTVNTLAKGEELAVRKVITVQEAATALNVSKGSVYNLVKKGELEAIRIGKLIRIPITALSAYLGYDVAQDFK